MGQGYRGVGTGLDVLRAAAADADRTAKRLAAERAKANAVEASVLALFRSADQLVVSSAPRWRGLSARSTAFAFSSQSNWPTANTPYRPPVRGHRATKALVAAG